MAIQRCGVGARAVTPGVLELYPCIDQCIRAVVIASACVVHKSPLTTDNVGYVQTNDVTHWQST